jgi:tRNA dimethylallyltransferase
MSNELPPVVAVVGPTAAGKSDLSLDLAERVGGEIVNTDAMQVYRGMDIGTAKLPPDERRGIPHHLLDLLEVTDPATVAEFQSRARAVVDDCRARRVTPVLVGGSALYTRAVLDRFEFPGTDDAVRRRLEDELAQVGPAALHERLRGLDPEAAAKVLPGNSRRVVRALEVIELTGRPFLARMPGFESFYPGAVQLGLDRADLAERVELRVHRMMAQGLLDEIRGLLPAGLRESPTAGKALGYAQLLAVLDAAGEIVGDVDEAVEQTIRATTRFVRRQRSWFRRDPRVRWLDAAESGLVERALSTLDLCGW